MLTFKMTDDEANEVNTAKNVSATTFKTNYKRSIYVCKNHKMLYKRLLKNRRSSEKRFQWTRAQPEHRTDAGS